MTPYLAATGHEAIRAPTQPPSGPVSFGFAALAGDRR
jgi:hypothetical protein